MAGTIPVGGAIAATFFLVIGIVGFTEGEATMGWAMTIVGIVGLGLSGVALASAARGEGRPRRRLERLEQLQEEGLITREEYEAKRAEVLEGL